jgi:hypothetical protein
MKTRNLVKKIILFPLTLLRGLWDDARFYDVHHVRDSFRSW